MRKERWCITSHFSYCRYLEMPFLNSSLRWFYTLGYFTVSSLFNHTGCSSQLLWNLPFVTKFKLWCWDVCGSLYEQVVDVDAAFSWHRPPQGRPWVFSLTAEPQMLLCCIYVSFVYVTFLCLAFCWCWQFSQPIVSALRTCLFPLLILGISPALHQ